MKNKQKKSLEIVDFLNINCQIDTNQIKVEETKTIFKPNALFHRHVMDFPDSLLSWVVTHCFPIQM